MVQASMPERCRDLPPPSSQAGSSACTPHQINPHPSLDISDSQSAPAPGPSAEALSTCTSPPGMTLSGSPALKDPEAEVPPTATEGPDGVASSSMLPHPQELSPSQPMEQEVSGSDTADATEPCQSDASQADSGEMESLATLERDQPEGERCSSSDSIPSVAAALLELHELLVSNNRAQSQNCSTSCSPSNPFRQDADGVDDITAPEPSTLTNPTPSTAITVDAEPTNAKANHATVSAEGASKCLLPDPSVPAEHLNRDATETVEGHGPPQNPCGSWERGADASERGEAGDISDISVSQSEPVGPLCLAGDLEFREAPEGQQGRGVADGRASATHNPDTLALQTDQASPTPMAVGSPEEVSSTSAPSAPAQAPQPTPQARPLPAQHPFMEQFPAEHIQRIQAAGFSAREAAEALEQSHGIVELALLALLARSITVPT
ncbi:protein DDI1 homolog 2 isoform X1 [Genypterus blacodes]|uniref:protein DDI1 homolog 2 isoform X1 n=1 Tax=Genypterus blacodes TaxID=154954 RepID=UPI003F77317C